MPSPQEKLLRIQKRVFETLRAEADRLLGRTPDSIRIYEREFKKDFPGPKAQLFPATKQELVAAIRGSEVTFVADFHTFSQAQRTALRLMRDALQPGESWFVGLELIPSQYQRALDDYQAGKLSIEDFHSTIRYDEEWGFPWKNYEPIFDWARENGVRLIALNRPKALLRPFGRAEDVSELHDRDQWAAGVITDIFHEQIGQRKRPRMLAIYGDLHVGTRHLPAQLKKISKAYLKRPLQSITIHQNHDDLYWRLARLGKETRTDALRLRKGAFCVFSGTPWSKLQSVVSYAEGGAATFDASEDSGGDDPEWTSAGAHASDYLSLMERYGAAIAEFMGIEPGDFGALTVKTIEEADFLDSLVESGQFTRNELALIRKLVSNNQRLYVPRSQIAYLGSPNPNAAAELAAVHLLRQRTGSRKVFDFKRDDYFRVVLENAFGFFGSLILNPRRKCDLPGDHDLRLRALEAGGEKMYPSEIEARRLTTSLLAEQRKIELGKSTDTEWLDRLAATRASALPTLISAKFLGQILGKKMHAALLEEHITIDALRDACLAGPTVSGRAHETRYETLVKKLALAPIAPSKAETL